MGYRGGRQMGLMMNVPTKDYIVETIKEEMGDGNHRVEKANDSYYMLKKSSGPFVIIECGFLSNPEEEKLLISEEYQQKMAKAVAEGIEKFLYNE